MWLSKTISSRLAYVPDVSHSRGYCLLETWNGMLAASCCHSSVLTVPARYASLSSSVTHRSKVIYWFASICELSISESRRYVTFPEWSGWRDQWAIASSTGGRVESGKVVERSKVTGKVKEPRVKKNPTSGSPKSASGSQEEKKLRHVL